MHPKKLPMALAAVGCTATAAAARILGKVAGVNATAYSNDTIGLQ
ncbi:MAG: hypothetical protein AB1768_12510 [Pseudomonadota bacterium]|jgi:hypothetical protein